MRQYGYPGAYFALSAIDKTGNVWYDVIIKCFIEKTCAAIVQNLKGGKNGKNIHAHARICPVSAAYRDSGYGNHQLCRLYLHEAYFF